MGELPTFLVQLPVVPAARTAVGWLRPLTERTHRGPTGEFLDDDLADRSPPAAASTGRWRCRATARHDRPGGTEPVPAVPVTLAVDPALVEELE